MLDEIGELAVGQLVLVGPAGAAEDAVEGLWVGLFDLAERGLQRSAYVLGVAAHVTPQAALGDHEAVVLRKQGELVVASGLVQRLGVLLEVDVADPLEEHQREDVCLEVGLVDAAAQQVSRGGKVLLKLRQRQPIAPAVGPQCTRCRACLILGHPSPSYCSATRQGAADSAFRRGDNVP